MLAKIARTKRRLTSTRWGYKRPLLLILSSTAFVHILVMRFEKMFFCWVLGRPSVPANRVERLSGTFLKGFMCHWVKWREVLCKLDLGWYLQSQVLHQLYSKRLPWHSWVSCFILYRRVVFIDRGHSSLIRYWIFKFNNVVWWAVVCGRHATE